jgi:hypothetical protein
MKIIRQSLENFIETSRYFVNSTRIGHPKQKGYILLECRWFMGLFGIYGSHTVEACPLNDADTAKIVIQMAEKSANQTDIKRRYGINKIIGRYHSALEHTFTWIVDADNAQQLQTFLIDIGAARFNTSKIVPLITFEEIVKNCQMG